MRRWCLAALVWGIAFRTGLAVPAAELAEALQPVPAVGAVFQPVKLAEMDAAIESAIADGACPGGVLWLERRGTAYHRAYGRRAVVPAPEPMSEETVFDAASLTKVVATTPAVMRLVEQGRVDLEAPAARYLPEFTGEGRETITVRHLLTHTSGLRPGIPLKPDWAGYDVGVALAVAEKPTLAPGTEFRYSDVNFILLGELVRRASGVRLDEFVAREIYVPLGMTNTCFLPPADWLPRIAPTEILTNGPSRGVVHDPTARRMGGVAGHAGLFTTAADLARFARLLLAGGTLDGVRIFQPETVAAMTRVQTPEATGVRRGLGWDIDSPYSGPRGKHFPLGSYGHTGWTGGSLWIDPFSETFLLFLSNRNHPTEEGSVLALRSQLGTLAAEAVIGFNFLFVPGALPPRPGGETGDGAAGRKAPEGEVLNGIDVLVAQGFAPLRGLKVGLVTNPTGQDRHRRSTADLLRGAPGVELKALFSPEHGIRAALDDKVSDSVDAATGLPIYSLYGDRKRPSPGQLAGLDALVVDLQDIGTRFYTYLSTLGLCLEAAAEARIKIVVLDRVNPINGVDIEGPLYAGPSSFTAFHSLPVRHGLTMGELARLLNAEKRLGADLLVVPVQGWKRSFWFDQTGLPWTNPSPNMRSLAAATLYPGIGLLESAVSVGRGTGTPFEVVGAPYVDDVRLAAEMNRAGLAGVRFIPVRFTPSASVFQGKECGGVGLVVTERRRFRPVETGVALALVLHRLHPAEFALDQVNRLLQQPAVIEAIRQNREWDEIRRLWTSDADAFRKRREPYLLYP